MPANFAHYRFGKLVLAVLPQPEKKIVLDAFDSYALGLHGPDVLFYYKPIRMNAVSRRGIALHDSEAYPFFVDSKEKYIGRKRREADLAYLFGFICHFALDSTCHPIVQRTMAEKNVPHLLVESSFDRSLMIKSGLQPERVDTARHVHCNEETIQDVSTYLCVSRGEAKKAISSFGFYARLLRPSNFAKREFLQIGMHVLGIYDSRYSAILPDRKFHDLDDSDSVLYQKMNIAVSLAKELIANYHLFVEDVESLDKRFRRNYEA